MKNPLSDLIDADAASVADLRAHIYFLRAPPRVDGAFPRTTGLSARNHEIGAARDTLSRTM
jgi:hypothetical protein